MNEFEELSDLLQNLITLRPNEIRWAQEHAKEVQRRSRKDRRRTSFGTLEGDELWNSFVGACGEIGWCRRFDKEWPARIDNFREADVGKRIQVRTRTEAWQDLRVKPGDYSDHAYFLAIYQQPNIIDLRGWLWGHEVLSRPAVDLEKKEAKEKRNKPVHLAPQNILHSLNAIPQDLLDECEGPFQIK